MSTYTAANTRFNACLRAVQSALPLLEAGADRLHAGTLTAAAEWVPQVDSSLTRLEATWATLAPRLPGYDQVLDLAAPNAHQCALDLTSQARATRQSATADRVAAAASAQLHAALSTGAVELGRQERLAVADAVAQAVCNLGYSVARFDGQTLTGVEAWRGHDLMLISVADQGAVEVDHAGIGDGSCLDRQDALEAEMSRLGVDLIGSSRTDHSDRRGGVLIAAAGRQADDSLARAVVRAREGNGASQTPARPPHTLFAATSDQRVTGKLRRTPSGGGGA